MLIRKGPDRDQEAVDWHIWLRSGEDGPADRAAFDRWHQDRHNAAAYAEIAALWDGLGTVLAPMAGVTALPSPPRVVRRRMGPRLMALAASMLAVVGTGYQYLHVWRYDHVAQGSGRVEVALADQSRIVLDAGAALDVDYTHGLRRVTLARGEAYFDVRHDTTRPFVVNAGSGDVRVLGTAFSVARDGAGGRVIVIRGKVRLRSGATANDVVPNQSVSFGATGNGPVVPIDAAAALGWSRGQLFFKDARLEDVIARIDRYYPGIIVLRNQEARNRRISAVVRIDRIDEWLAALGRIERLTVRHYPLVTNLS